MAVPNGLSTQLLESIAAQGSNKLENPAGLAAYYGYLADGTLVPDPALTQSTTRNVEASKTEPDKNTYLHRRGLHGADAGYRYGTHFLFQGHEGAKFGYLTRVNLDADEAHRVTRWRRPRPTAPRRRVAGRQQGPQPQQLRVPADPGRQARPHKGRQAAGPAGALGPHTPITFQGIDATHPTGGIFTDDQKDISSYGVDFDTRWVTVHDTAVDDSGLAFDANALAKAAGATPLKRPENGVFRPGTGFREFFFETTGDTNATSSANAGYGGWGTAYRLSQSGPSADHGKLHVLFQGDQAHDNEITGIHMSDGDPSPAGILGAKVPQPFRNGWRLFWTQQHGQNVTWEIAPS